MRCEKGKDFIVVIPETVIEETLILEIMSTNSECYLKRVEDSDVFGIKIQDRDKPQT